MMVRKSPAGRGKKVEVTDGGGISAPPFVTGGVLTDVDRMGYVDLLLRGASPAAAATRLGVDLYRIVEAIAEDEEFRMRVDAAYDALSQNVAARLYQEAMQGSVTAMTFWLKHRPPPEWPDYQMQTPAPTGLDALTDEELLRLARLENIAIPAELAASLEAAGSAAASLPVPQVAAVD